MLRRYLTEQEQQLLLKTISNGAAVIARRDCACVRLLRATGLRIGEFSTLTLGDATTALSTRYLFIPRERRKGKLHDHTVLVTQEAEQAIGVLMSIRAEMDGADDVTHLLRTDALVISRKGGPMTPRAWQHRFKVWAREAGLPADVSPHWMRHTRAMNIMRRSTSNDPRGIVQAALGHVAIASTGIYTQVTREELEEQLALVDDQPHIRKRDMRRHFEAGRAV